MPPTQQGIEGGCVGRRKVGTACALQGDGTSPGATTLRGRELPDHHHYCHGLKAGEPCAQKIPRTPSPRDARCQGTWKPAGQEEREEEEDKDSKPVVCIFRFSNKVACILHFWNILKGDLQPDGRTENLLSAPCC